MNSSHEYKAGDKVRIVNRGEGFDGIVTTITDKALGNALWKVEEVAAPHTPKGICNGAWSEKYLEPVLSIDYLPEAPPSELTESFFHHLTTVVNELLPEVTPEELLGSPTVSKLPTYSRDELRRIANTVRAT
jgi:hypothetical protein